jgi:hypothetical protein
MFAGEYSMTLLIQRPIWRTSPDFRGLTTASRIWSLTALDASRCLMVSSNGSATFLADSGSAARIFASASSPSSVS